MRCHVHNRKLFGMCFYCIKQLFMYPGCQRLFIRGFRFWIGLWPAFDSELLSRREKKLWYSGYCLCNHTAHLLPGIFAARVLPIATNQSDRYVNTTEDVIKMFSNTIARRWIYSYDLCISLFPLEKIGLSYKPYFASS